MGRPFSLRVILHSLKLKLKARQAPQESTGTASGPKTVPAWRRLLAAAARGVAFGLIVAVVALRQADNLPRGFAYPNGFSAPRTYKFQFEEVWLTAEDGTLLSAWFVPAAQSERVLIVLHGSAVNLGYLGHGLLESLTQVGVNVLALDYRGYGKSAGLPEADALSMDAEAAWQYLTSKRRFRESAVFIHGLSIGGEVAVELASRHRCGGLIAEATPTSSRAIARMDLGLPLLEYALKQRFNSIEAIRKVRAPVLVIHGTRDSIVPFDMGQKLFEAASAPKALYAVENADHDNPFVEGGQAYRERVRRFILTGP